MSNVSDLGSHRSGKDRPLRIATGPTVRSNKVKNQTLKWREFVEMLGKPVVTQETIADYLKFPRETQDKIKDVGYFVPAHFDGGIRKGKNLGPKDLGTLDFDHAKGDYLSRIRALYGNLAFVLYTTHKHVPEHPRFRLVFLFSRGVTNAEYPAIMRALAAYGDINECDDTTFEPSRVMHFASHASDAEFVYYVGEGGSLDVDKILATYLDWTDISEWPVSDRVKNPLRSAGQKAQDPREKQGFVGAFCNTYDIQSALDTFLPDVYEPGSTPNRLTFVGGSTSNGAVIYDDGLFLYSHHESDPCGGKNVNAFDLVRLHKFASHDVGQGEHTAPAQQHSYKAMVALTKTDPLVQAHLYQQRLQVVDDFEGFDAEPDADGEAIKSPKADSPGDVDAPPVKREKRLTTGEAIQQWKLQINDDFKISKDRLFNIEAIMENDPRLTGCVASNLFTGELMQRRRIPGLARKVPAEGIPWSDVAEYTLQGYFNKQFDVAFNSKLINQACVVVASKHEYDPVRDWMDTLVWDGTPRLDTFLPVFLGTEANAYTAAIFRKWMCAGVARTYRPGTKFDFILVLEGIEGVGKSRLLEALAHGWFCGDFTFGLESKKVIEQTAGALIVEIAEMVSKSNTEVEHTKAMLSRGSERARLSYARNAVTAPRRWIAAGTTNENTYLKGDTGHRRFWVARSDGRLIDIEAVKLIVPQLWAEARELWQIDGEALYLDVTEVSNYAVEQQALRVEVDDWSGMIAAWLDKPIRSNQWELTDEQAREIDAPEFTYVERNRTCALEVWIECLDGTTDRFNQQIARRISGVFSKLPGWKKQNGLRLGVRYGKGRGFLKD